MSQNSRLLDQLGMTLEEWIVHYKNR